MPVRIETVVILILCVLAGVVSAPVTGQSPFDEDRIESLIERARTIDRLHALLVVHEGEAVVEHMQAGPGLSRPANIKSVSKTLLSGLAGIAIERGLVDGLDHPIVDLLGERVPEAASPGVGEITFGHALSMQTGLQSTSGRNYGRWVQSPDWIGHVLTRPMVDSPGGRMIYSTGATHLVSAALTEAGGASTHELARQWLGEPLNIRIPEWMTDPQGVYFGGNEMRMSPRALARFGEVYRRGGTIDGKRVIPQWWVEQSWSANGRSPWTGDRYGYGWFITEIGPHTAYYGRGYGGQALFVIPQAALTVVITSDPTPPSRGSGFRQLRGLVAEIARVADYPAQSRGLR